MSAPARTRGRRAAECVVRLTRLRHATIFISPLPPLVSLQVGISGKYGTRYGASLRKLVRKLEVTQHAKVSSKREDRGGSREVLPPARPGASPLTASSPLQYTCVFCGKHSVQRTAVGIWDCKHCKKTQTGGAFMLATAAASTVRSNIGRLRASKDTA